MVFVRIYASEAYNHSKSKPRININTKKIEKYEVNRDGNLSVYIGDKKYFIVNREDISIAMKEFSNNSKNDEIEAIKIELEKVKKDNKKLRKKIKELNQAIIYQPGGKIYQEAKTDFEEKAKN